MAVNYEMAGKQKNDSVSQPSRGRCQKIVALDLPVERCLRDEADARGWRFVNLWYYNFIPAGTAPPNGLLTYSLLDGTHVQSLLEKKCPAVRVGNLPHPGDHMVPAVLPDHHAAGRLAADHFAEREFRHVAFFGNAPWSDGLLLFEGFQERAVELGMTCHLNQFQRRPGEGRQTWRDRKRTYFQSWVKNIPKPVGIFAPSAKWAAIFCGWTKLSGLDVPTDVAVLSRGRGPSICEYSVPTISYVDPNEERQIRVACELLDQMMAGKPRPQKPISIPPSGVIEMESTSVLATPDKDVAAALRFMWDNLNLELTIEDVAAAVDMSSRQIERRFRKALNRSINQELRRKRLEELKRLLRSTNLPISELGPQVGYRSTTYLHRCFRAAFDITPDEYRRITSS